MLHNFDNNNLLVYDVDSIIFFAFIIHFIYYITKVSLTIFFLPCYRRISFLFWNILCSN